MRLPKHTPGPWLADPKRTFTDVCSARLHGIARVYLPESDEGRANLRLILSAPRLFELFEDLYVLVERIQPDARALEEARELFLFIDPRETVLPFPVEEAPSVNPFPTEVS